MSRESAYRLRKKRGAEEFAHAWDMIMGNMHISRRKVTLEGLYQRIKHGTLRPVMRGGKYAGTLQKPNSSAILRVLAQADRSAQAAEGRRRDTESHTKQKGGSV